MRQGLRRHVPDGGAIQEFEKKEKKKLCAVKVLNEKRPHERAGASSQNDKSS